MSNPSRFRSTEWLAEHISAPDVVVVDGSWYLPPENRNAGAEYKEAHIPGAVFLDIDVVRDETSSLPHMMPSTVAFSSHMRKLGIGDGQTIIVYDGAGLFAAARVWWMFRAFGVQRVFILEGGLPQWQKEGRKVDSGVVKRPPRHFTPRLNHGLIADLHDVSLALTKNSAQILDARPKARFDGHAPEPRAGVKAGHMPGAINVPFPDILKNGKLQDKEELTAAFEAAGVDLSKPVITSCGSGVSAAILWLALDSIGKTPKALYDGSWAEWGSAEGCVVEVTPLEG